jgi:CheY-like chemotaxis protein
VPSPANSSSERTKVLLADNDEGVGRVLVQVLARQDIDVEWAADGEVAVQALRAGGFKLLICDLDMPKLSGEEVLEHLSKIPASPPALVISGYLDASSNRRLLDLPGVKMTLRKPFDIFAFARLVADLSRGGRGEIPDELANRAQVAVGSEEAAG